MPFANLEWPRARRKEHGIIGARGSRPRVDAPAATAADGSTGPATNPAAPRHTQRVTAADLQDGRIRVPRATKALLPSEPAFVDVELRGNRLQCLWDPRSGPKKARSGVLRVPRDVLDSLVSEDEVLRVRGQDARVVLD